MFSLGMSIDKKHHALMKVWACNSNKNITCYNVATYTAKLCNHTMPNKENQITCINFWGLEVEINKYGKQLQLIQSWKFKS